MNKTKTTRLARVKLMFALPLAITMMLVISCSPNAVQQEEENKVPPPEQSEAQEKPTEATPEVQEETQIFTVVEEMPEYPGGMDAMYAYLGENIQYPDSAKINKISGKVYVTFVIEKDGSVTNVEVLRGIGGGCDKEAMRVVSEMPNWEPGKQRGQEVRVQYNLPIKFTLD